MRVAEAAAAAARDDRLLAGRDEVGEERVRLVLADGSPGRDVEDEVVAGLAVPPARVPRPPGFALKWWRYWKSRSVVCPGSTRRWTDPPRPPSPPSGPPRGTWASWRKVAAPSPPSPARTQIFTRSRNIAAILARAQRRDRSRATGGRGRDGCGLEVGQRVDPVAAVPDRALPDLEVEVRAGGEPGRAHAPDALAAPDAAGHARPTRSTCGCTSCTARSRGRSRPGSRRRCSSSRRRSPCRTPRRRSDRRSSRRCRCRSGRSGSTG